MKLSKIYTNLPALFSPVDFVPELNVVVAEIRLPENKNKDTHNLGKTSLGRLLDFCFLEKRNSKLFLFKHENLFNGFVFFLEIELAGGAFLTVRRSVADAGKISFKKHEAGHQDFTDLPPEEWDHNDVSFDRARSLLDSLLDWRGTAPWQYRQSLGYLLRSQEDYRDVFQLGTAIGRHAYWKPFLAHLLGFNSRLIDQHYDKEAELARKEETAQVIRDELGGGSVEDLSKIDGLLLLKAKDAEKKQALLDAFDFRSQDKETTKELVDNIDQQIASLNNRRYSLGKNKKKITSSLSDDQILFNPDEAERLFQEVGVLFSGQIKKDFKQLIAFNRAVTDERRQYLLEEREDIDIELKTINAELNNLGRKRSEMLSFLSSTDVFAKFKHVADELVGLKADIAFLERQRTAMHRLQELRAEIRSLTEECRHLQGEIEDDVEKQNSDQSSRFSAIRLYYSEIVEEVINRKALLSVSPNSQGHLDFKAEILDESGNATSADAGHTYRKLLCIAFDLAVLRAHLDQKFPRFVYHDGVFESLDDRKKENLLNIIRQYASLGLQPIITLIDSDMPPCADDGQVFTDDEVVATLHDEGDDGRLFKMRSW
ncbi:hypothetical protein CSQ96_00725 [Janthinobacterium sp. BJB412]|nr:hypothetical protein CSQ96_00725 [Janthinobacterium sp. BJB412]